MKANPILLFLAMLGTFASILAVFFFIFVLFSVKQFGDIAQTSQSGEVGDYKIGVIEINGVIMDGKEVIEKLHKFYKNPTIKGIILRINSPGGAVAPSQEIYHEILSMRTQKTIVASMSTVAASGGYYIAAAANKIVASAGTLTGSIGVIMQNMNMRDAMDYLNIRPMTIKSGQYKDAMSPLKQLDEQDKQLMQALVDDVHMQFKKDIAKGRNMSVEQLSPFADGRILTGLQAFKLKLVDEIGGLHDAARLVAKLAKLEGQYLLVYPRKSRLEQLEHMFQNVEGLLGKLTTRQGWEMRL